MLFRRPAILSYAANSSALGKSRRPNVLTTEPPDRLPLSSRDIETYEFALCPLTRMRGCPKVYTNVTSLPHERPSDLAKCNPQKNSHSSTQPSGRRRMMDNRRTPAADHHHQQTPKNAPNQQKSPKTGKRGGGDYTPLPPRARTHRQQANPSAHPKKQGYLTTGYKPKKRLITSSLQ